jgi:NAD(P)-dependent dehydrogenase (short-subunit alcohol dehydrogenase family)
MISFDGRSLLIFGGGSGIGLAAACLAGELGAAVAVADIDPGAAERVARLGERSLFARCDARDPAAVREAFDMAVERFGRLDAVLTTVGGAHVAEIDELDIDEWDAEVTFNLTTAFNVCQAAAQVLQRQRAGAIVTTSSGYAVLPGTDRAGYVAAKAGVIALTRSFAARLAPYRVRVNCIAPGPTDTPRFREMNGGDEGVARVRATMPMGEIPTPEECASVALFLLSDAARQVTGQVIHVNGGLLMP